MTYNDFISRFERRKPYNRGFMVVCPAHDDSPKSPSLAISPSQEGGVLLRCFANCTNEQIVSALGLTMKDLFANEKAKAFTPPPAKNEPSHVEQNQKPTIDKIYSYKNALGVEVYQAIRLIPKSFRQRHKDEAGKWVWTMDGVIRVLYRLPEVLSAQMVIICEGEKDADNLIELGFTATCNVGGAGKWLDSYTESLAGKEVVICGDNDEAGKKHVDLVFNSVAKVAKLVKLIRVPDPSKDASDYIKTFKTKEDAKSAFDTLISSAYPHVNGIELPLYTIAELETDYRRFVRSLDKNAFSLGKWLPSFNQLRPLVPGELVFFIGDTGIGKTSILQMIAKSAAPLPQVFFELELPREMMFERFTAAATQFKASDVECTYRDYDESLQEPLNRHYANLVLCPKARLTLDQIDKLIVRSELKLGQPPKIVHIDYIQLLMSGSDKDRRERVSDIAEGLKVIANERRVIIFVTSQITRPPREKGKQKSSEPHLHSAKESGSIEASSQLLCGVWREPETGLFKIRVLKSTKGGGGLLIDCKYDGARSTITEIAKETEI